MFRHSQAYQEVKIRRVPLWIPEIVDVKADFDSTEAGAYMGRTEGFK
jgi:hypothetical protein